MLKPRMLRLQKHSIVLLSGILCSLFFSFRISAQIVVEQCDTMIFTVTSRPTIPEPHYVWGIYEASDQPVDVLDEYAALDPALYFVDGMYASGEGRSVKVLALQPGLYYVRIHVWDEVSCTDNVEMYLMQVVQPQLDVELYADSVCIGNPTSVHIVFSGNGPYDMVVQYGDALSPTTINLNGVVGPEITVPITDPLPVGETRFWIMEVTDDCKVYSWEETQRPGTGILIYPKPSKSRIYLKE